MSNMMEFTVYKNWTNSNREYEDDYFPPLEALGPSMQAFLIALYSLTALLSLGGNATVIIVLLIGKRSSRELRVFLVNLALSDITMAVFSIPFTYTHFMLGRWIFDPLFCPFVLFMQHCSVIVSVYTLTAIGVDRYYAIMYPLSSRITKSRGPFIVMVVWMVAIALSSFQLVHGKAEKFSWNDTEYYECTEIWGEVQGKVYTAAVFTVTFLLPMVILTFAYASIGWKMWRHTSPGNADMARDHQQLQAKMKVVKMLAMVVLLFALCWLPIQIFNLLVYFRREVITSTNDTEYYSYIAAFFCCHWLSMSNSFVNPIIYCFMSDNFRVRGSKPHKLGSHSSKEQRSLADLKTLVFCCFRNPFPKGGRNLMTAPPSSFSSFRTTTLVLTSNCSVKSNYTTTAIPLRRIQSNSSNPLPLSD